MAHALRVARSSGVVLFSYMAQPDFDDIRLIVGMPRANLQELQSPTPVIPRGVGLFFVPASIFGHHAAPLL